MFDEGRQSATFVNAISTAGGGLSNIAKPVGIVAGDLVLLTATNALSSMDNAPNTHGVGAWTVLVSYDWANSYGYTTKVWSKIMTASDISNNWGKGGNTVTDFLVIAYSNVTSVALKTSNNNKLTAANTLNLGSFSVNSNSRGVVTIVSDRDPSQVVVQPNTFVTRISNGTLITFWSTYIADKLTGYSGENISWANTLGTNGYDEAGVVLELIGS